MTTFSNAMTDFRLPNMTIYCKRHSGVALQWSGRRKTYSICRVCVEEIMAELAESIGATIYQ